jgi:hypothetical protein
MPDLERLSIDDAQAAHDVLDAIEDADWRASQPREPSFKW